VKSILLALTLLAAAAVRAEDAPSVTLDVKDADIREILLSMKKQCGIRNMLIDDAVGGKGTYLFREVPCETALKIVFRTQDLDYEIQENSVVIIRKKKG
jgi:type II secretory pathway component HofQ